MSGTATVQLPESFNGVERYGYFAESFVVFVDSADFGQVKEGIEQHGRVSHRQDESVSVRPYWVLRIKAKELLPEAVSDRRHRHGSSRMPRIGGLHPIHSEGTDRVDAGQIHCFEPLVNMEGSRDAPSRSFHAVVGRHSALYEAGRGCGRVHFVTRM